MKRSLTSSLMASGESLSRRKKLLRAALDLQQLAMAHEPCPMPPDFPLVAYDSIAKRVSNPNEQAWNGHASAWNGVAFRFRAAASEDERFTVEISGNGQRHAQEDALFGFFYNAISAIECFYYAAYNWGAIAAPAQFSVATEQDLRAVNPKYVVKGFKLAFKNEPFTASLSAIEGGEWLREMKLYRDVLTHRGTMPRNHFLGVLGKGVNYLSSANVTPTMSATPKALGPHHKHAQAPIDATTTRLRRVKLAEATTALMEAGDKFLAKYV